MPKQDQPGHKPNKSNEAARRSDEEAKHITDSEESMRGPISSVMQSIKEEAEDNDKEDRKKAEQEAQEAQKSGKARDNRGQGK